MYLNTNNSFIQKYIFWYLHFTHVERSLFAKKWLGSTSVDSWMLVEKIFEHYEI